uniref:Uncharacterized protein n=1 Tax=Kalanchoe fedtschenkoi TaxID=63787 RepID=A0A7N0UDW3_KALFE
MRVETEAAAHHLAEADRTAIGVADVFLGQYYEVLESHPELVHKFYVDASVVSRPGSDGSMTSVTTLKGIDDLIQSLYVESESEVEICTADAQYSYGDGLVILVTGLVGSKKAKKRFSQMFFLAPQERGYYVLNDVFMYTGEEVSACVVVQNDAASREETESTVVVKVEAENGNKDSEAAVVDKEVIIEPKKTSPGEKVKVTAVKSTSANGQPNGKLSYASMVKTAASSAPAPPIAKAPSPPTLAATPPAASAVKELSNTSSDSEKKISPPAKGLDQAVLIVEDRSVSVWELPLSIKPYQLDRVFSRKFGPVKQGGIQIRNSQGKNGPICYAFIEFESASSAEVAIKASPVSIDGRPVIVKRKTTKSKNDARHRTGSPHRDNRSVDNTSSRAPGRPSNPRSSNRQRDASNDSSNAAHRNDNGHMSSGSSQAGTPTPPSKPEIDEDGFQTVSRNGKWKSQSN